MRATDRYVYLEIVDITDIPTSDTSATTDDELNFNFNVSVEVDRSTAADSKTGLRWWAWILIVVGSLLIIAALGFGAAKFKGDGVSRPTMNRKPSAKKPAP